MADDTGLSDGRDVSLVNFAFKPLLSVSGGGVVTHLLNYSSRISVEIRSTTMQIVFRSRVTTRVNHLLSDTSIIRTPISGERK